MISTSHGFVFIQIPKTASTSVSRALKQALGPKVVPHHDDPELSRFLREVKRVPFPAHATARQLSEFFGAQWSGFFRFAFVRNPWACVYSNYAYMRKIGLGPLRDTGARIPPWRQELDQMSFEDFVFDDRVPHLPQSHWVTDAGGRLLVNELYRFEAIDRDYERLCQRIGVPHQPLPVTNVAVTRPYQEYYTDPARQRVAELYAADIKRFDYGF